MGRKKSDPEWRIVRVQRDRVQMNNRAARRKKEREARRARAEQEDKR